MLLSQNGHTIKSDDSRREPSHPNFGELVKSGKFLIEMQLQKNITRYMTYLKNRKLV